MNRELNNGFSSAFKVIQGEMQKTRNEHGEIYDVWESNLAMYLYDAVPGMTSERANEIASKWLDRLFEIDAK